MLARILFLFSLFYLPLSFANNYKRGHISCHDFQLTEKQYKEDPTEGYAGAYALCLLTRGGEDATALSILEVEADRRNQVPSANLLALYITSGGTMDYRDFEEDNYNEAFQAWGRVVHLINWHPDYPKEFPITENREQQELRAYRYLTKIPFKKYIVGLKGTHNSYRLQSPTYNGNRNLNLYPKYSPYTLDSLEQTIQNATICLNLPQKNHFKPLRYHQNIKYCEITKEASEELLVLEKERLSLLNDLSCARDIEVCAEYQDLVFNEIMPIINKRNANSRRIWQAESLASL